MSDSAGTHEANPRLQGYLGKKEHEGEGGTLYYPEGETGRKSDSQEKKQKKKKPDEEEGEDEGGHKTGRDGVNLGQKGSGTRQIAEGRLAREKRKLTMAGRKSIHFSGLERAGEPMPNAGNKNSCLPDDQKAMDAPAWQAGSKKANRRISVAEEKEPGDEEIKGNLFFEIVAKKRLSEGFLKVEKRTARETVHGTKSRALNPPKKEKKEKSKRWHGQRGRPRN